MTGWASEEARPFQEIDYTGNDIKLTSIQTVHKWGVVHFRTLVTLTLTLNLTPT